MVLEASEQTENDKQMSNVLNHMPSFFSKSIHEVYE